MRHRLGLRGQVDADAVALSLDLSIERRPLLVLEEMRVGDYIMVADRLEPWWQRWVVAHAIGHCILHTGNHYWMRRHTDLGQAFEREAEDFAYGLLVNPAEAAEEGLSNSWEVAKHFGVPLEAFHQRALSSTA
ncbi:MAG: ImmA/IrrE family metallo-endopeptidase [Chloroflexota bacterium]|nr:ImmA/IrrE family metallo-endopeptidase [Chloroflexota bacterium]